jgi:low affinity Fe/Cu permease
MGMARKAHPLALEWLSRRATHAAGSSWAFATSLVIVIAWLASGPFFKFSNTWQLVINTGTTIVTFLMVFLIQRSQNKDSQAIHLKLNEIIASLEGTSNRLVDVEDLSEAELAALHRFYAKLSRMAAHDADITASHSIDGARSRHDKKQQRHQR